MEHKRVGIVGAGSWGTALSILLANNGYNIDLWVYEQELYTQLNETRINSFSIPLLAFMSRQSERIRGASCVAVFLMTWVGTTINTTS